MGGKYRPRRKEIEERYSIQDHEVCCPQKREIHYGNNYIKITITPDVVIEEPEDQYSEIPTELPTEALSDVVGVAAPRLTSLILAVDKPGVKKAQTIKKSGLTRDVTNVTMKAQSHKIERVACANPIPRPRLGRISASRVYTRRPPSS